MAGSMPGAMLPGRVVEVSTDSRYHGLRMSSETRHTYRLGGTVPRLCLAPAASHASPGSLREDRTHAGMLPLTTCLSQA